MRRELTNSKNISGFTHEILDKLYADPDAQWNTIALIRRILTYPLNERISPLSETFFAEIPDRHRRSLFHKEAVSGSEEVDT